MEWRKDGEARRKNRLSPHALYPDGCLMGVGDFLSAPYGAGIIAPYRGWG